MGEPKHYWLDSSANVTKLYRGLWVLGIALVVIGLFLHEHQELYFVERYGFYAIYGFFACVALVLAAKQLRRIVMRSEDYYDR